MQLSPPPWHLKGDGHIFIYHLTDNFIDSQCFISDFQKNKNWLNIACVMIVDYHTSGVGAYKELLFIPALFDFDKKKAFNISKIYVSTEESVYNGIENWGIPKQLANFNIQQTSSQTCQCKVSHQDSTFFEVYTQSYGLAFPLTSRLFPFTFYQPLRGQTLITTPTAKGWGRLCKIKEINIDSNYFPNIAQFKPLIAIAVKDFSMIFPMPKILVKR
ncbi:MAG: acetoacetate decarboxylase family protein [Thermoflexibacter sp.]|jgi:hypothetical protein|nr:acetoacetate decarboxylase family protein [Thermoflexibacter sp.]